MAVPTWSVGQVLTADDVNQWLVPIAVYKAGDEGVTSSTTLQDDDSLLATLAANASYSFELTLWLTGATLTNGDFKFAMAWPSGASGMWMADGVLVNGTYTDTTLHVENSSGTAHSLGVDSSNGTPCRISGSVKTSSTPGPLKLQWAQNSSSGIATDVKAGSKMIVQRTG